MAVKSLHSGDLWGIFPRISCLTGDGILTGLGLPEAEQPDNAALTATGRPVEPSETSNFTVAYGQSKSADVLFALGLTAGLYEKHGILSLALHPGAIMTELSPTLRARDARGHRREIQVRVQERRPGQRHVPARGAGRQPRPSQPQVP
ncbi:hypothetical protein Z517_09397 [Fonsecaea pedrosoi CBS 271.37]|uniref:Uncharacterized protein n=1 Tax=Fonsecaea pedrosoi CBS 271.37 TaxID=1442368 RepID=A0A0D2G8E8_9EURO|nr:uncharacterized protein Z517_09397 [Fonsecaea pedrosoi CBS 271.37]KIW76953.1 hypothetical protein Z517_09397 [Fonsecaea pedrosoi CBS 271.37]